MSLSYPLIVFLVGLAAGALIKLFFAKNNSWLFVVLTSFGMGIGAFVAQAFELTHPYSYLLMGVFAALFPLLQNLKKHIRTQ